MITRISTIEELQRIFIESVINNTDSVTKVTPNSILSGIGFGVSNISQRAMKDIALVESRLDLDIAYGQYLDQIASNYGISRGGTSKSTTYVRLVGDEGTNYSVEDNIFTSTDGFVFELENSVTIGNLEYTYAKVKSVDGGAATNVAPNSITTVSNAPTGHRYVINEFMAQGGRDVENDLMFRRRLKNTLNGVSLGTIEQLTQIFQKTNPDILTCLHGGYNNVGQVILYVVTQNGVSLSLSERNSLIEDSRKFLSLSDLNPFGSNSFNIEIKNVEYYPIDISFRCELFQNVNSDDVRISIQNRIAKLFNPLNYNPLEKIQWDDLLQIVKSTEGVKYVADQTFVPSSDFSIPIFQLPRLRGFLMSDISGNIIQDVQGNLNPVFYPNNLDFNFQNTLIL